MIKAGVAEAIDPVHMDREGNVVSEDSELKYGLKVDLKITHPEMCLVADEVSANTCQRGDGHPGGQKKLCERGSVLYQQIGKKDKHFTCLGFTNLLGDPVLCVIIVTGKEYSFAIESGIDYDVDPIGNVEDEDCFEKNVGEGKYFPGGPTCNYKGTKVPFILTFQESGGMTGQILIDVLKHMDALNLFTDDRQNNNKRRVPFLLVDGHDSRFNTSFLHYINNESTQWMVCIGVPYGTSYWQVGDSNEQNGSYKMGLTREKQEMINKRITHMNQDMQVRPTYIVPLVNKVWKVSFDRDTGNSKEITLRKDELIDLLKNEGIVDPKGTKNIYVLLYMMCNLWITM
jgi:hypothetical protein